MWRILVEAGRHRRRVLLQGYQKVVLIVRVVIKINPCSAVVRITNGAEFGVTLSEALELRRVTNLALMIGQVLQAGFKTMMLLMTGAACSAL